MHDRKQERDTLKRKLENGTNLHMPAPRRIGKTWTIAKLAEDLRAVGWHVVEVDVEGMRTAQEFAKDLCRRIEQQISIGDAFTAHVKNRIGNLLGGGWGDKPLDALGRVEPVEFLEQLVAALDQTEERSVILIDEIAYFVLALAEEDEKAANSFAYKLRALQQRFQNVRWLVTGSIGLNLIAQRYGLEGAFVDLEIFELEPFSRDEARSFMRDPAIRTQFNHVFDASDDDFDWMFGELGWLAPYYLKLVGNEVRPSHVPKKGVPTATREDFAAAFDKLLTPGRRSNFAVWPEHIRKNLVAAERDLALKLLGELSRSADGETLDTLEATAEIFGAGNTRKSTKAVLSVLETDGLIERRGERYAFRSGLIRRYWNEYEAE